MKNVKNIVPSITRVGAFIVGVTLIQRHNMIKKKINSESTLVEESSKISSNSRFVEFDKHRSYIELAKFEDKHHYMDLDELEANRHYIVLGEIIVKKKTL